MFIKIYVSYFRKMFEIIFKKFHLAVIVIVGITFFIAQEPAFHTFTSGNGTLYNSFLAGLLYWFAIMIFILLPTMTMLIIIFLLLTILCYCRIIVRIKRYIIKKNNVIKTETKITYKKRYTKTLRRGTKKK